MIPAGHGLVLRAPIPAAPNAPIMLRCVRCPGWHKRSTFARRAADFAAHELSRRHRGLGPRRDRERAWRLCR